MATKRGGGGRVEPRAASWRCVARSVRVLSEVGCVWCRLAGTTKGVTRTPVVVGRRSPGAVTSCIHQCSPSRSDVYRLLTANQLKTQWKPPSSVSTTPPCLAGPQRGKAKVDVSRELKCTREPALLQLLRVRPHLPEGGDRRGLPASLRYIASLPTATEAAPTTPLRALSALVSRTAAANMSQSPGTWPPFQFAAPSFSTGRGRMEGWCRWGSRLIATGRMSEPSSVPSSSINGTQRH